MTPRASLGKYQAPETLGINNSNYRMCGSGYPGSRENEGKMGAPAPGMTTSHPVLSLGFSEILLDQREKKNMHTCTLYYCALYQSLRDVRSLA